MAIARRKSSEEQLSHRQRLRLIVVTSEKKPTPTSGSDASISDVIVIDRPDFFDEDVGYFEFAIANALRQIAAEIGMSQQLEPQRLFEAKEYRAAVISAMTLLEATLRQRLGKEHWTDVTRPVSLRSLIDRALGSQIITPEDSNRIRTWMKLRNEAVHTAKPVGRAEAKAVVDGVARILALPQEP